MCVCGCVWHLEMSFEMLLTFECAPLTDNPLTCRQRETDWMSSCGDRYITKCTEPRKSVTKNSLTGRSYMAFCSNRANKSHSFSMRITISERQPKKSVSNSQTKFQFMQMRGTKMWRLRKMWYDNEFDFYIDNRFHNLLHDVTRYALLQFIYKHFALRNVNYALISKSKDMYAVLWCFEWHTCDVSCFEYRRPTNA